MIKFIFHPRAKTELAQAMSYYQSCAQGLEGEFYTEIATTIARIQTSPNAWPKIHKNIHRCMTKRFPYGIVYTLQPDHILIIAVMHLHRKPGYWSDRLQ
ncbi:MAG: type II toxin-antitoxin system RelE/ParE family toxin [Planctomycetota bacterium]